MRSLIDRVIQEEGLYVYNIHNLEVKHFRISIAPVRSLEGVTSYLINHSTLILYEPVC
jgi:hypothetical protein